MDEYKQLNYYRLTPDEVLAQLHSRHEGLSEAEAVERLEQLGSNELHKAKNVGRRYLPAPIQRFARHHAAGQRGVFNLPARCQNRNHPDAYRAHQRIRRILSRA